MRTTASLSVLVLAASVSVLACSSSPPLPDVVGTSDAKGVVVRSEVVVADSTFSDAVVLKWDRMIVPTAGNEEMIAKLQVGKVVVGRHNSHEDPNANNLFGFVRNVTGVTVVGPNTEILTTIGSIGDLFSSGTVKINLAKYAEGEPASVGPTGQSLHTLSPIPSGGFHLEIPAKTIFEKSAGPMTASLKLKSGYVNADPQLELDAEFDYKRVLFVDIPKGIKTFDMAGNIDVEGHGEFEAEVTGSGALDSTTFPSLSQELIAPRKLFRGVFWVGLVPVEFVVTGSVSVECDMTATGSVKMGATVTAKDTAMADVNYDGTEWTSTADNSFTWDKTLSGPDVDSELTASCWLPVKIAVHLFESIGPFVQAGPTMSFESHLCKQQGKRFGFNYALTPGIKGVLGAEIVNPIKSKEIKTEELSPFEKDFEPLLKGDFEASCDDVAEPVDAIDPCLNATVNGYYCGNELSAPGGASKLYSCIDQVTTATTPCPTSCVNRGNGDVKCE